MFPAELTRINEGGEYLSFIDTELKDPKPASNIHLRRCEFSNVGLKGWKVNGCAIRQTRFINCYLPAPSPTTKLN